MSILYTVLALKRSAGLSENAPLVWKVLQLLRYLHVKYFGCRQHNTHFFLHGVLKKSDLDLTNITICTLHFVKSEHI